MSFDKIKAMRNAEKFLAQGKIRAAINEYKRVVENDPKDFSTLNMLGDLHAKASDTAEAIKCFSEVAEYYGAQGFAQKAIAIYNKISRLSPGSLEISAKLAELYQSKGSIAEARSHYSVLAEQYQRKGNKTEALAVFRQIAQFDLNNSDVYLKIADLCLQESSEEEAATAYVEAGLRLSSKKNYDAAINAFNKALEIRPNDLLGLKGIVKAQVKIGYTDEAAKTLEKVLESEPHNREIIFLLIECYLDTNNPRDAERVVTQLVEREPANYQKYLDVVQSYLKKSDTGSAARVLSVTSEHLLAGGQANELQRWINEVLAQNPEQLEALRLLVRLHGWQREEASYKESLERLAETAHLVGSADDERFSLSQLVMIAPHEADFARRLQELNAEHHFDDSPVAFEMPVFENQTENVFEPTGFSENDFQSSNGDSNELQTVEFTDFSAVQFDDQESASSTDFAFAESDAAAFDFQDVAFSPEPVEDLDPNRALNPFEEARLQQELESVEFYIAQGYQDLALQSLDTLESELGARQEILKWRAQINGESAEAIEAVETPSSAPLAGQANTEAGGLTKGFDILSDFRAELGLEETEEVEQNDFDTHYQLGIAYKEMGLMEDAIRELQDAVKIVSPDDGTRRFLLSCNMLGHCFMEKGMSNLALMWYKRCLETANLSPEEKLDLSYEVANAYEVGDDRAKATEYFEKIYAENVDYRDVTERLDSLRAAE